MFCECVTDRFHYTGERRAKPNGKLCWNGRSIASSTSSKACCMRSSSKSVMFFFILYQILAIKSVIKQLLSLPKDVLNWSPENGAYNWITTDQLSQQPSPPQTLMKGRKWDIVIQTFILTTSHCCALALSQEKSSSSLYFPKAYYENLCAADIVPGADWNFRDKANMFFEIMVMYAEQKTTTTTTKLP